MVLLKIMIKPVFIMSISRGIICLIVIGLEHPVGVHGGGCDHLYHSHQEGLVGILVDEGI